MKKLICFTGLLLILWFTALRVDAPPIRNVIFYIPMTEALHPYGITDHTLLAFIQLESKFDEKAKNKVTGARGILQYTPIMIREVNKIQHKREHVLSYSLNTTIKLPRYTWKNAYDPIKSIEMWWIVQNYKNPNYDLTKACKIWFGTGKQYDGKTWKWYQKKINEYLSSKD